MEYRWLGKSGLQVSELCLGTMTFGSGLVGKTDENTARRMIDCFLDAGGNFVDTADIYGTPPGLSEEIVGRALKGKRDKVILATKVFGPTGPGPNDMGLSRTHIIQAVEASLRRLQTDYIDLYYVHEWDKKTALEEVLLTLNNLVESGKVRYLGASNFAAWQLMKALMISELKGWAQFVCFQPEYSLVVRDIEREILPLCRNEGLGVAIWGPLGGGFLSGKYHRGEEPPKGSRLALASKDWPEAWHRRATEKNFRILEVEKEMASSRGKSCVQVALAWVRAQPGITSVIIGARTLDQLKNNLGSVGWELTSEEIETLNEVSKLELGYPYRELFARPR